MSHIKLTGSFLFLLPSHVILFCSWRSNYNNQEINGTVDFLFIFCGKRQFHSYSLKALLENVSMMLASWTVIFQIPFFLSYNMQWLQNPMFGLFYFIYFQFHVLVSYNVNHTDFFFLNVRVKKERSRVFG